MRQLPRAYLTLLNGLPTDVTPFGPRCFPASDCCDPTSAARRPHPRRNTPAVPTADSGAPITSAPNSLGLAPRSGLRTGLACIPVWPAYRSGLHTGLACVPVWTPSRSATRPPDCLNPYKPNGCAATAGGWHRPQPPLGPIGGWRRHLDTSTRIAVANPPHRNPSRRSACRPSRVRRVGGRLVLVTQPNRATDGQRGKSP
jgi:hypothetical protein